VIRFLFIVEGNSYYPQTVLDPGEVTKQIDLTAKYPIEGHWHWYTAYNHKTPIIVSGTDFAKTIALPSIASQGLSAHTAVVFGLSSRVTGGGHTAYHGVLSSTRTVGGAPGGQTIDAYLAGLQMTPQGQPITPYDAVRLGVVANNSAARMTYTTCAFGKGKAAPAIVDPLAAYNVLFGLVGSAAQATSFVQRKTLLDFAQKNVTGALATFNGGSTEQQKLTTYSQAIEALGTRQERLQGMAAQLKAVKPVSPDTIPNIATDCMVRFSAQLKLAVAALKGQLTNVVVLTSGTGDDFNNLIYPSEPAAAYRDVGRHPLHHQAPTDPLSLKTIYDMTKLQFDAVAAAAKDLMSTPDPVGAGSMLDNTIIVFISDNGEYHHSTASEFPVVLIGGANVGLKTGGTTFVYPGVDTGGASHRQVSNLWNTLGHLAGASLDTFGGEGSMRVAPGPLVDLMA
jgi:hypothetical protein